MHNEVLTNNERKFRDKTQYQAGILEGNRGHDSCYSTVVLTAFIVNTLIRYVSLTTGMEGSSGRIMDPTGSRYIQS